MHIWTETPEREIWRQLRYFRSPANVYNLLSGKLKTLRQQRWEESDKLASRSYDIAACIRQADDYYQAASEVGLSTEPLLQFYGAQSLAKACILANDPDSDLLGLKYHGLSTRWTGAQSHEAQQRLEEYSGNPLRWEVESEYAITNAGVFPLLCSITYDSIPQSGQILFFKELIRLLPDLTDLFSRHYGECSHCFYLADTPGFNAFKHYEVLVNSGVGMEAFRQLFPELQTDFTEYKKNADTYSFLSNQTMTEKPSYLKLAKGAVAGIYLVKPHAVGIHSPLSVQYAALFILSNVVRYKPSFWMRVIEGEKTGAASIVEAFCNLSRRRFPSDILQLLWNEEFSFGTPGYIC